MFLFFILFDSGIILCTKDKDLKANAFTTVYVYFSARYLNHLGCLDIARLALQRRRRGLGGVG